MRPTRSRLARNDQLGFATTAKAMLLVLAFTGVGFLAAGHTEVATPLQPPSVGEKLIPAQAEVNDPDAELRPWLREAQPPSF
ncbi:MAG: hypothetical protein ACKVQT_30305 [Burkholderiales bacterium]